LLGLFGAAVLCWLVALLLARHVAPAAGAAHAARQPSALPPVLINELLPHTDPPQVDAIEFYNSTGSDVDVSRWCLTDNHDDPLPPSHCRRDNCTGQWLSCPDTERLWFWPERDG
jgi:hypothetical protein